MYRNAQFLRGLVASCDSFSVTKCYAFLALLHEEKAVAIGFRGSNDALQLLAQGGSVFNDMQEFMAGGFVSSYFFNAFSALWNDSLNDEFVKLRAQYPDYQVWIAGHSLGGAIANMCASHIVAGGYIEPGNVKLATFGEPRTGDKYYAAAHDILIYYKASMKYGAQYKVCKELEDSRCSNGLWFANSIDDHTSYFEVSVSGYGIRGCT
ncbi:unnamed protein product [Nippostrongylus brasiliensis]|uniref:Lipase_3 domain-containing protein n=1 Tax=Nippostrongylus brasiliensis TaxID=27835 RepID=A0A0N4Y0B9_NIPBR|nr:unnamed protein product [Nippostrongylus brasiliensis]